MQHFVKHFFRKYPLLTNCVTYGSLYLSAEFSQQLLTKKVFADPKEPLDFPQMGRFGLVGTTLSAPVLHVWYKWLDKQFSGTTTPIIVKKVLLDQFFITPILLVCFYISMSLLEMKEDPFQELRQKFFPTFTRSCLFWLPATTVNFLFISPDFRVIYVGLCALVWVNILCWIKRQKISEVVTK